MFSVVQLVLSSDPASQQKLKGLASGFGWETGVLRQLPSIHFWTPASASATAQAVWYIVIGSYIVYTYSYWSAGFDYVRRIRAVGDALVSLLRRADETSLASLETAATRLRAAGWSATATSSALWFLTLINARIMYKNDIYQQMKPNTYGAYRVVSSIGVLAGLAAVHPVAAGLYVASQMKKMKGMKKNARLYSKYFAALPEQFRSGLHLPDSAIEV
jgi:hypothetical protein